MKNTTYIYSFYRFKELIKINQLKIKLDKFAFNKVIYGTVLIANEGLNGTISGTKKDLDEFIVYLKRIMKIRKLSLKISENKNQIFDAKPLISIIFILKTDARRPGYQHFIVEIGTL